jgi:hypothetical protein
LKAAFVTVPCHVGEVPETEIGGRVLYDPDSGN